MPIKALWDNPERTLIRYQFEAPWSWNDFSAAVDEATKMLDSADRQVRMIIDVRNASMLPTGALEKFRGIDQQEPHSNLDKTLMAFVGANVFVRAFASLFLRIYRLAVGHQRFIFVGTLEEARARLVGPEGQTEQPTVAHDPTV